MTALYYITKMQVQLQQAHNSNPIIIYLVGHHDNGRSYNTTTANSSVGKWVS